MKESCYIHHAWQVSPFLAVLLRNIAGNVTFLLRWSRGHTTLLPDAESFLIGGPCYPHNCDSSNSVPEPSPFSNIGTTECYEIHRSRQACPLLFKIFLEDQIYILQMTNHFTPYFPPILLRNPLFGSPKVIFSSLCKREANVEYFRTPSAVCNRLPTTIAIHLNRHVTLSPNPRTISSSHSYWQSYKSTGARIQVN